MGENFPGADAVADRTGGRRLPCGCDSKADAQAQNRLGTPSNDTWRSRKGRKEREMEERDGAGKQVITGIDCDMMIEPRGLKEPRV